MIADNCFFFGRLTSCVLGPPATCDSRIRDNGCVTRDDHDATLHLISLALSILFGFSTHLHYQTRRTNGNIGARNPRSEQVPGLSSQKDNTPPDILDRSTWDEKRALRSRRDCCVYKINHRHMAASMERLWRLEQEHSSGDVSRNMPSGTGQ